MSFLDHLEELRSTLIQSFLVFLLLSMVCWFFSGWILDLVIGDLPVESLYFHSPIEAFMIRVKLSFIMGFMLAFPFILYKVWAFVSPGLFETEKRRVFPFLISSSILFYSGVIFCYLMLIPVVLNLLLKFGTPHLTPLLSVTSSLAFVGKLCFTFGIVFQLPVIVVILSLMGLITPRLLLRQWKYAIVVIFFVAAVLTPPDAISQLAMALPVLVLFFGSVLVAHLVVRRKKKTKEDEE
jgi:sec-independent protein translocase protein TatC